MSFTPDPNYTPPAHSVTPEQEVVASQDNLDGLHSYILYEQVSTSYITYGQKMLVMGIYTSKEEALRKKKECEEWHSQEIEDITLQIIPQRMNTDNWLSAEGPETYIVSPAPSPISEAY